MTESGSDPARDHAVDKLESVLDAAPVRLAILFGSRVTGRTHAGSDIDIAIELDGLRPGDGAYNDVFFELSAELSAAAHTDAIDLVDIHSVSPGVARSILDHGRVIVGEESRVDELRRQLPDGDEPRRSAKERFDDHLARIEELLA